jgi:hypothetical protein
VSSIYESLLNNFKSNGFSDSYEKLDIEYKDWQGQRSFFQWINGWWWQYGYSKWRVVLWSLLFLLVFAVFNCFIYERLMSTYDLAKLKKKNISYTRNILLRWVHFFLLSLVYTGFIFFKLSLDFDKVDFRKGSTVAILFFEYSVGLLCTGYMINWLLSK